MARHVFMAANGWLEHMRGTAEVAEVDGAVHRMKAGVVCVAPRRGDNGGVRGGCPFLKLVLLPYTATELFGVELVRVHDVK